MLSENFLEALKSRLWLIVLLPLGAAVTAGVLTMSKPPTYASSATLLVDFRTPIGGEVTSEVLPVALQTVYLATQVDIIKSRAVAERVAALLNLAESELWKERFVDAGGEEGGLNAWIIGTLQTNVEVVVGTDTRLLNVWYRDLDPKVAAAVANAFVQAYMDVTQQLGQTPATESAQSVDRVIAGLRANLEQAEAKVSQYQASTGIIVTDERLDVETAHLNELIKAKLEADSTLRSTEARLQPLEELFGSGSSTMDLVVQLPDSQVIRSLQVELARKEAELSELSTSLGDGHPDIRRVRAEVKSLRTRLVEEARSAVTSDLRQARQTAEAAQKAETQQRQKILELRQARDGLQPLLRELESARESYDKALAMSSQYTLSSNLNQTNVSVLTRAEPPDAPVSQNLIQNTFAALVAGFLFAVALVVLLELMDKRVRSPEGVPEVGEGFLGGLPKA